MQQAAPSAAAEVRASYTQICHLLPLYLQLSDKDMSHSNIPLFTMTRTLLSYRRENSLTTKDNEAGRMAQ